MDADSLCRGIYLVIHLAYPTSTRRRLFFFFFFKPHSSSGRDRPSPQKTPPQPSSEIVHLGRPFSSYRGTGETVDRGG